MLEVGHALLFYNYYGFTFDPFAYKIVYSLQVKNVYAQGKSMILYRRGVLAGTC